MTTNLDRYKKDLEKLISLGSRMQLDLTGRRLLETGKVKPEKKIFEELKGTFERDYQKWYTEASALIRQLIPDRLAEFQELYKGDGKRKATTIQTYHIQDWLNGVRAGINSYTTEKHYDDFAVITMRFGTQLSILEAVGSRFESSLYDIRQLVQADLFDSEIEAGRS